MISETVTDLNDLKVFKDLKDLNEEDLKDIKMFSLFGLKKEAKITKVYDGDTCHAIFQFSGKYYVWIIRLEGLDTPEIKSENPLERDAAILAKNKLEELILDKIVNLDLQHYDKYGRILAKISTGDIPDISKYLISLKLGREYHGQKKEAWSF
jgi:micrococcal nuclease